MNTYDRVARILKDNFDVAEGALTPQTQLSALAVDSLGMIEILFAVEDEFKVTVPREDRPRMALLATIDDLVGYVDALMSQQRTDPQAQPSP